MTKTLPHITTKQQAILKLLYRYRFLNRTHIQTLLDHKDKRRIISWLKDLREKEYIAWHYDDTNFIAKSQPAIYYLALNGIRYLRELDDYPNDELRKRYKEPTRTQVFINRCLLIADCTIALRAKNNDELKYSCVLPSDYVDPNNEYHFLNELIPHLYFTKQYGDEAKTYVLESFEQMLPRYQLRKRLKDYVEFLAECEGVEQPIVLFVCATTADLLYVKRRTQLLFDRLNTDSTHIRVTTINKVTNEGVGGMIWEEIQ